MIGEITERLVKKVFGKKAKVSVDGKTYDVGELVTAGVVDGVVVIVGDKQIVFTKGDVVVSLE